MIIRHRELFFDDKQNYLHFEANEIFVLLTSSVEIRKKSSENKIGRNPKINTSF